MPKFLAVHATFPTPLSLEEGAPLLKRMAGAMTADAYWITSWCQTNAEGKVVKVYCRWDGTSLEAVRAAAAKLLPEMPVEAVYPLVTIDAGDFR